MEKDLTIQENKGFDEYQRPIIILNEKRYLFSSRSLIIFPFGLVLTFILIFYFFDLRINAWLEEIVAKQTVLILNLISNDASAEVVYIPEEYYPWYIFTTNGGVFYIATECAGAQVYGILGGIVLFTPHSKISITRKNILWRKTKFLIIAVILTHLINISRLTIQILLYTRGFQWELIHQSISDFSAYIASIIILTLICYTIIPEFFISIYYGISLIISKVLYMVKKKKYRTIKKKELWIFAFFLLLIMIVIISLILAKLSKN